MALQEREQKLIGIMLIVGAIAAFVGVGLPSFDTMSKAFQKKKELDDQIKNFDTQKQSLQASLEVLRQQAQLPNDMQVRQFTEMTKQKVVKEILDSVVKHAADRGNTVISLKPWADVPDILPPPPAPDPAAAPPADPQAAAPAPPPPPPLVTMGYEFSVRGTYQTIQNFLEAMDAQKEIIEINSIQLLNEAGADRVGGSGAVTANTVNKDPNKPIRLSLKLRLVLEQKQI